MKKLSLFLLFGVLLHASPEAPSHLVVTPAKNSVTLTWKDRSDDERGFKVFRNGEFIAMLPNNDRHVQESVSFTDRGVRSGTFYRYEVRSTDDIDSFTDSIKLSNKDNNLIFSLKGRLAEGSHPSFFIDADNNPNSGYNKGEIIGADYLVSNGHLYTYPAGTTGWHWNDIGQNIQTNQTNKELTVTLPLNMISHTSKIRYTSRVSSSDWTKNIDFSHMKEHQINTAGTPIVIIGSSTVHLVNEVDHEVHEDRSPCTLEGWGEILPEFAVDSQNIYNLARAGASAGSFLIPPDHQYGEWALLFGPNKDHYWGKTKEKMEALGGGLLLIQFGGNDSHQLDPIYGDNPLKFEHFKFDLQLYIDAAKKLNFTPILITSPNSRDLGPDGRVKDVRGGYPNAMRELATREGIRLLDLYKKSFQEFRKLTPAELDSNFGNCYREMVDGTIKRDRTHLEEQGARRVAKWVTELACEDPNSRICKQFR